MTKSSGIILAAGGITLVHEWLHQRAGTSDFSVLFRVGIATAGAAAIFAGLEHVSEPAAVGIATIALITVLVGGVTPGIPSPIQSITDFMGYGNKASPKGKKK